MKSVFGAAIVAALLLAAPLDARPGAPFSFAVNARKHGVRQTPSGLQYRVLKSGDGVMPGASDIALVTYAGRFTDGKTFDASAKPVPLPLTKVIPGFAEGLALMRKGAIYRFWIPSSLGYGEKDVRDDVGKVVIPANSTLVFDVMLVNVTPGSGNGETEIPAPK